MKENHKDALFTVVNQWAKRINPAELLQSDVSYQPEEGKDQGWETVSTEHLRLEGETNKSVEYTDNNGDIYVYPAGAKILLNIFPNRHLDDKYTATFISEPILKPKPKQSGGKRRSTKNRRRRSRSTRRNKRR